MPTVFYHHTSSEASAVCVGINRHKPTHGPVKYSIYKRHAGSTKLEPVVEDAEFKENDTSHPSVHLRMEKGDMLYGITDGKALWFTASGFHIP